MLPRSSGSLARHLLIKSAKSYCVSSPWVQSWCSSFTNWSRELNGVLWSPHVEKSSYARPPRAHISSFSAGATSTLSSTISGVIQFGIQCELTKYSRKFNTDVAVPYVTILSSPDPFLSMSMLAVFKFPWYIYFSCIIFSVSTTCFRAFLRSSRDPLNSEMGIISFTDSTMQ